MWSSQNRYYPGLQHHFTQQSKKMAIEESDQGTEFEWILDEADYKQIPKVKAYTRGGCSESTAVEF